MVDIMALVKTFNANDLLEEFRACNRDYFSFEACEALVNLFDECGTNTELDIIGLCCEFTESDIETIYDDYKNIDMIADCKDEDGELDKDALLDALNYYTWAVETEDNQILYQCF